MRSFYTICMLAIGFVNSTQQSTTAMELGQNYPIGLEDKSMRVFRNFGSTANPVIDTTPSAISGYFSIYDVMRCNTKIYVGDNEEGKPIFVRCDFSKYLAEKMRNRNFCKHVRDHFSVYDMDKGTIKVFFEPSQEGIRRYTTYDCNGSIIENSETKDGQRIPLTA